VLECLFNKLLLDRACLRIAQQTQRSPSEVRQRFSEKITCYSNNGHPKPIIDRFKFDPLPIMAISVDMLDTGYDHKEVENLVMLRPTSSAMKYAQMRGRGSRLCPRIGKTEFLIFDFVNNHARFDDPEKQYHAPREVGRRPEQGGGPGSQPVPEPKPPPPPGPPPPKREFKLIKEGSLKDEFRKRHLVIVGPEGLAIDTSKYQDEWRKKIIELQQKDPVVSKILAGESITPDEWEQLASRLNAPEMWFDEASLRQAFDQPTGSLNDFIRSALGLYRFPSREERVERAFAAWVTEHSDSLHPDETRMLHLLRNVVLASTRDDKHAILDATIFSRAPFTLLGGRARMESLFGRDRLYGILDELNTLIAAA
jgi:type I restriction enzyme R subunit